MIQKKQIDYYHTNGFLVVEDLIPKDTLQKLQKTTQEFVSKSAPKKHNDFDVLALLINLICKKNGQRN